MPSISTQKSLRKILLVTPYGNGNFGNILQRCALASVLESYGFEVEHLCGRTQSSCKSRIKNLIKRILAKIGVPKFKRNALREKRFKTFQDANTGRKIYMTFNKALRVSQERWKDYEYAITGSDQVWHNWYHQPEELAYYYLEFMPREKRISYAPSFGFSKFPESDYELHRKGLEGIARLSCREEEMQNLIMQIVGRDSELVLDPSLLLNRDEWKKFESKPKYDVPEKYILCYFLGNITEEYEHAINEAAGGLPVIHVYDSGSKHAKKDSPQWLTHPGEFLYLFEHADFVCTDSFHGAAFSINFGKNFLAFKREQDRYRSMFGRIESLLMHTGLTNHVYESGIKIRPDELNHESVNQKLSSMRKSSKKYLRESLKI